VTKMRVEIVSKKENPGFGRQEVRFSVKESSATPSRKELREKIAALTGAGEKNIVVGVLETRYGSTALQGIARIYKSEKELKKTELEYITARNFGKAEVKKEAEAAGNPEAKAAPEKEGAGKEAGGKAHIEGKAAKDETAKHAEKKE